MDRPHARARIEIGDIASIASPTADRPHARARIEIITGSKLANVLTTALTRGRELK